MTPASKRNKRKIESYSHTEARRANNPPVGLVTPETDTQAGKKRYAYDPHIDPQLQWAGKAEHTSFDVQTVSLHVHERIDPRAIIEAARARNGNGQPQSPLFETPEENPPLRHAIEFYKHSHNWTNRMIAGDNLLVMNSLIEKEGMAGKVQTIYIDPPYGIRYGSNFQPFVNKRDVKDGADADLTAEPEQVRAFRDTWELGIHSYLTYLRDRLLLAREMLTDSGSVFVQIGDENVHRIGTMMDEVFGDQNRVATISFATTSGSSATHLPEVADYLLWYAKDKNQVKYHQLYEPMTRSEIVDYFSSYAMVELPDGSCRKPTDEERFDPDAHLPKGSRIYRRAGLDSQGVSTTGRSEPYEYDGRVFLCGANRQWSISMEGLDRLAELGRLDALESKDSLMWRKYEDEVPGRRINSVWPAQMYPSSKRYVVETSTKAVQRCILMTTDPGDLVLDPTCGSGTTAYVAEQWGRRWITCDTSRVALALARQRLMTAVYDYYELVNPDRGVESGFRYKTVPYVSPSVLAGYAEDRPIALYDQPRVDRTKIRVSGPFTVEAVPAPVVKGLDDVIGGVDVGMTEGEVPAYAGMTGSGAGMTEGDVGVTGSEIPAYAGMTEGGAGMTEGDESGHDPRHDDTHSRHDDTHSRHDDTHSRHDDTHSRHDDTHSRHDDALPRHSRVGGNLGGVNSGETVRQGEWMDELLRTGIRGKLGQYVRFARLEPLPGMPGLRFIHGDGETLPNDDGPASIPKGAAASAQRVVVSFGPEHAPMEQRQVALAVEEAYSLVPKPGIVVFAAFQFDPEAAKDIDVMYWPGVAILKAQMNPDLLTDDLKKRRASNESFWLIGQPDVEVRAIRDGDDAGKWQVDVRGFDYYNTKTGGVESGGEDRIAVWMLDTDYDGRSLYPRQVFFPMAGPRDGWDRLSRSLRAEVDAELLEAYRGTTSLPFEPGAYGRIAVKIVDDRGIESLRVVGVGG